MRIGFNEFDWCAEKIATNDLTVLIQGQTGVGKTTLAKKIHEKSARSSGPFVSINLACLHEGTLESELFGHEKGAFTGAEKSRVGKLELAHGGTVFLDEIGDLSVALQARLLDVIQFRTLSPLGSNRVRKLDLRIIAATHRNLKEQVEKRTFREDLFHRLRVMEIEVKSIQEQAESLDEIVQHLLSEIAKQQGKRILGLSKEAVESLEYHCWSGNLRELNNALEYAVSMSSGGVLQGEDLPPWLRDEGDLPSFTGLPLFGVAEVPLGVNFQEAREFFERVYLAKALSRNGGRLTRTARQIGLSKTTLLRRARAYGILRN